MPVDKTTQFGPGSAFSSPARKAFAITPSDTQDLAFLPRGVYVGGDGSLAVILADDTESVTFTGVPAASLLPIRVKRVLATGTTASGLVGVY